MITITRILCPVDQSDIARRALDYAVVLAKRYGASVCAAEVVSVVLPTSDYLPPSAEFTRAPGQQAYAKELAALEAFVAPARRDGVTVETRISGGFVVEQLLLEAQQYNPDLIVMGTHGRSGVQRLVLGSVAEKVLRRATCPVLTVPPAAAVEPAAVLLPKTILCAVDFSDASLRALEYAMSVAQESDATLLLMHVVDWAAETWAVGTHGAALADYTQVRRTEAEHLLRDAVPVPAREWCTPEILVTEGKPWREILRVARERQADLVVLGVLGRGAVDLTLFGSTTHHVVREAPCPVLTVRGSGRLLA
jgi:nucleotide-binding universal stress UspA family protein